MSYTAEQPSGDEPIFASETHGTGTASVRVAADVVGEHVWLKMTTEVQWEQDADAILAIVREALLSIDALEDAREAVYQQSGSRPSREKVSAAITAALDAVLDTDDARARAVHGVMIPREEQP